MEAKAGKIGVGKTKERREETRRERAEKKKPKERVIEVKKVAEEWEIWDKEEVVAKRLIPERFHKWIHVFSKKASKRMTTRKLWNHAIDIKEGFVLRKGKVYLLLREKRYVSVSSYQNN